MRGGDRSSVGAARRQAPCFARAAGFLHFPSCPCLPRPPCLSPTLKRAHPPTPHTPHSVYLGVLPPDAGIGQDVCGRREEAEGEEAWPLRSRREGPAAAAAAVAAVAATTRLDWYMCVYVCTTCSPALLPSHHCMPPSPLPLLTLPSSSPSVPSSFLPLVLFSLPQQHKPPVVPQPRHSPRCRLPLCRAHRPRVLHPTRQEAGKEKGRRSRA